MRSRGSKAFYLSQKLKTFVGEGISAGMNLSISQGLWAVAKFFDVIKYALSAKRGGTINGS
jgi:hypothetical protein